jgi:hypothetical protein
MLVFWSHIYGFFISQKYITMQEETITKTKTNQWNLFDFHGLFSPTKIRATRKEFTEFREQIHMISKMHGYLQ